MSSLQRIFHVHTKRQIFPSAWRLLLGHGHGNHREHCDIRHSDELPRQSDFTPAREEGPRSALAEATLPPDGSALLSAPRPAAPGWPLLPRPPRPAGGAGAAQKAHICGPGHERFALPIAKGCSASPTSRAGLWWSVCVC